MMRMKIQMLAMMFIAALALGACSGWAGKGCMVQ